ncbi:MAG TPA: sensor histidine kinase [Caulobacterales bacterium]|nr:sensor histidine kinase [Caulobacterales bacterium]
MMATSQLSAASRTAESDHRVANSLAMVAALVRIQAKVAGHGGAIPAARVQSMFEETAGRIEAIARLHRLLSGEADSALLDVDRFLGEICDLARQTFDPDGCMALHRSLGVGLKAPAGDLSAIGLIVNEAIVNAYKYSHPTGVSGQVRVACQAVGASGLLIVVEDDGVGLPEHFDPRVDGGVGIRIMVGLAEQIGARLSFSSNTLGLSVQLLVGALAA